MSSSKISTTTSELTKLKVNPKWAKLPLFDRKGWKTLPFGVFADSIGERVEPADAREEIYVGLDDLDSGDLHIKRWGKGSDVIGTKLRFRKGDIIFGRRRAYQRKLAVAEFDGICSAHAMVVRAKPELVLPEFLPFLMMSDKFMRRAVEISVGSLSPTINWKTLKLEEFVLPPLDQQRRLAEVFWQIEHLLVEKRRVFEHLKSYAKVAMRDALAGNLASRRDETTNGVWEQKKLGEVCDLRNGRGFSAAEWAQQGLPIIRIQNLNGSREFNYFAGHPEEAWIVESGTLLFAWAGVRGVSFGPCIWNGPTGVLNQHIFRITPIDGINKRWLYETLKIITAAIEKKAHGFKIELVHARKGDITDQVVLVPPPSEQAKVAALADSFESGTTDVSAEIGHLSTLRTAILNCIVELPI
jgi:type I restriction enzyme S subunit